MSMLGKIFNRYSPPPLKDSAKEEDLAKRWGSAFDVFFNNDLRTDDGVRAVPSNAMLFDTVYSCVNVLSDDIAKLPFKTYRKTNGHIEEIVDNDVHRLIRIRPNNFMSPFDFVKLIIVDMCVHGNFYAFIQRGSDGEIEQLIPLTSSETIPVIDGGRLFYQTNWQGKNIMLFDDEVIHIKNMSLDGIVGLSPIEAVRTQLESIDIANKYNRKMVADGALPQGILTTSGALNSDAKQKVREAWEKTNLGHSIAIVDHGLEYKQIGISQSDMQWLQAQKYNQQRIASIYKVPLHKINDLDNATYTNIEHQSLDYVKNTLQPIVTRIEEEFGYKLYSEQDRENECYVKFNMDSELRGDSEARAKVHEINLRNGFKTINEVRASNEDSPYEEDFANEPFISLNLAPAKNIEMFNNNHFGKALNGMGEDEEEFEEEDSQEEEQEDEEYLDDDE